MRPVDDQTIDVWAVMPEGFEAYARILHPLRETLDGRVTWRRTDQRTSLAPDVALGDVFPPGTITKDWLDAYEPTTGSLPPGVQTELVGLLSDFTATPNRCWMAVWDGWGIWLPPISIDMGDVSTNSLTRSDARLEGLKEAKYRAKHMAQLEADIGVLEGRWGRRYYLFEGPIEAIGSFEGHTPQYWWPQDHSWFAATEVDSHSTYVGSSAECIDAILASAELEALSISLRTRLDPGL